MILSMWNLFGSNGHLKMIAIIHVLLLITLFTRESKSVTYWNKVDSHKVILIGDTGIQSEIRNTAVSNIIQVLGSNLNNVFGVLLGDNFYEHGVTNYNVMNRFKLDFTDAFPKDTLNIKWYSILGNHDYAGDIQTQINLTNDQSDDRWQMSHNYYSKVIHGTNYNASFIFIDTQELMLAPFWAFYGLPALEQIKWIQSSLEEARFSSYIYILGHHPLYSIGPHYVCPLLRNFLLDLFHKYSINAYICGHNHNLVYFKKDLIGYVTSGAGSKQNVLSKQTGYYSYSNGAGFATLEFNENTSELRFIEKDATIGFQEAFISRTTKPKSNV